MGHEYEHEYPPSDWTAAGLAETLESTPERYPIPTYEDAPVWEDIWATRATNSLAVEIRARAREISGRPVPSLPASLYLEYVREGSRDEYDLTDRRRRDSLSILAVAECLEREGRYLDDVLDYAWSICEQSTWAIPAHIDDEHAIEGLPGQHPGGGDSVKLFSVATGLLLAELEYVLGDRLHPALRDRISREVDRRILRPYEERDHHWMEPPAANWNAVCNSGVAISALHLLDDERRQARIVARAAHNMRHYLESFDASGATAEGIGYWNYGFEAYVKLTETLAVRTGGEYDLGSVPVVAEIARFPLRVRMSPGRYVPFSDTEEDILLVGHLLAWLAERYDDPGLAALARDSLDRAGDLFERPLNYNLPEILRDLAWGRRVEASPTGARSARRDYLAGCEWWIRRLAPDDPGGLVVAAKGGHNDEPHNHNDAGTFVVHVNGESLLTDLGREPYDRDYFGPRRYTDYLATRSLGHSVPYVNGCEQQAGAEYASNVLESDPDSDVFAVDLAGCYPDSAGLESLVRRVEVHDESSLTVADEVAFASDALGEEFESVVVSDVPMTVEDDALVVTGEAGRAVVHSSEDVTVAVEHLEDAIDPKFDWETARDVHRARFEAPTARETGVDLSVETESTR